MHTDFALLLLALEQRPNQDLVSWEVRVAVHWCGTVGSGVNIFVVQH